MQNRPIFLNTRHGGIVFLLLLLLSACHPKPGSSSPDASSEVLDLHVYYLLDEKYHEETSPEVVNEWKKALIEQLGSGGNTVNAYDLLSHRGGGPAGAEWNSDGGIWIVALADVPMDAIKAFSFFVNGKRIDKGLKLLENGKRSLLHLEVPSDDWQSALVDIEKADYPLLYTAEDLESHQKQPNGQIGEGKILKIRVDLKYQQEGKTKTASLTRAFHRAGGE